MGKTRILFIKDCEPHTAQGVDEQLNSGIINIQMEKSTHKPSYPIYMDSKIFDGFMEKRR